jgi:hypothetical protein
VSSIILTFLQARGTAQELMYLSINPLSSGLSVQATAAGTGARAHVTLQKTRSWFQKTIEKVLQAAAAHIAETKLLRALLAKLGNSLNTNLSARPALSVQEAGSKVINQCFLFYFVYSINLFTYSFLFIYLFVYLFIYLSIYSFIKLFIVCVIIYLFRFLIYLFV